MNYRLDLYDQHGHLCDVRCYRASTGETACEIARQELDTRHADHGDLLVDDTTGDYRFYTLITGR